MHVSNVCRIGAALVNEIETSISVKPGINAIPVEMLEPRQIKITDTDGCKAAPIRAGLKEHRGSMIPVIEREVARELVRDKVAEWLPQGLLVYTMEDYLADNDPDIKDRAVAKASGEELVAVAVVGENRSALAVCRNIVSGCQNMDKLEDDAKGAMEASNIFLVE